MQYKHNVKHLDANLKGKNPRTHNQDWIQPKKVKIKLKRTWPNDHLNQRTIVIGCKLMLVDIKEIKS
jgi:hypothetical protein